MRTLKVCATSKNGLHLKKHRDFFDASPQGMCHIEKHRDFFDAYPYSMCHMEKHMDLLTPTLN